jgi:leucyl/phenylalanyl-tRNA--protein transferase
LFELGYAHCVEAYYEDKLVGGLYGITIGGMFCGESMFHTKTDASKVAFYYLIQQLKKQNFDFIDAQIQNNYLKSFGVEEIDRNDFFVLLNNTKNNTKKFIIH